MASDSNRSDPPAGGRDALSSDSSVPIDRQNLTIDAAGLSADQLRSRLRAIGQQCSRQAADDAPLPCVTILNLHDRDGDGGWLPFHDVPLMVRIDAVAPSHSFFCMTGGEIDLRAGGGDALATGLAGGVVRIRGDVGDAVGAGCTGGTLAVHGRAGHRVGAAMTGGGILIRGNAGDDLGHGGVGGTIVVGGDVGHDLGLDNSGTTIFVLGDVASLAPNIVEAPMRKQAQLRLSVLLMNASVRGKPATFHRYLHRDQWAAERRELGEVSASWR